MTRNGAHRTLQDRRLAELSNSKRTAKNPRPKPKRDFFNRIGRKLTARLWRLPPLVFVCLAVAEYPQHGVC
ncbi:hypothetical protein SAMN05192563_10581 [Paraburkholderia aspalathi]|uniref:Uncharacterized protein n=1 Tax=Paraburkholderia aspalathi TaxID=1324617 RepID=A0A1I7ERG9_9BURK|nr:hypothetical protein SAMN05192563_10581 [Paraburkholderia aspalathi]